MVAISARRPYYVPPSVCLYVHHAPLFSAFASCRVVCRIDFFLFHFSLSDKLCLSEKFNEVRTLQLHYGCQSCQIFMLSTNIHARTIYYMYVCMSIYNR